MLLTATPRATYLVLEISAIKEQLCSSYTATETATAAKAAEALLTGDGSVIKYNSITVRAAVVKALSVCELFANANAVANKNYMLPKSFLYENFYFSFSKQCL